MNRRTAVRTALVALLALGALGCRGGGLGRLTPTAPGDPPGAGGGGGPVVSLTAAELAPVDAWISARTNPQWIVGDTVMVVASREYFATALTITSPAGAYCRRTDEQSPDETRVTLRYLGSPASASVMTNPRVMIGTGLTISARRVLVVRLVRTTDVSRPVSLRVDAQGEVALGKGEQVLRRAGAMTLGGDLARRGDRHVWEPIAPP
jgi:hypothetical protein